MLFRSYRADEPVKDRLMRYHGATNYSAVDLDLIDELYRRTYREKVLGRERLRLFNVSRPVEVTEHTRLRLVLGDSHVSLDYGSQQHLDHSGCRWPGRRSRSRRRIQRSVWTGRRRIIRHGRRLVHVELHDDDRSGSEGDRQRDAVDDIPAGHELGFRVQSRPRPNVAPSILLLLWSDILLLCSDERPNLVALEAANGKIANIPVMVVSACATHFAEQLRNSVFRNAHYPNRAAYAHSFAKALDDCCALGTI